MALAGLPLRSAPLLRRGMAVCAFGMSLALTGSAQCRDYLLGPRGEITRIRIAAPWRGEIKLPPQESSCGERAQSKGPARWRGLWAKGPAVDLRRQLRMGGGGTRALVRVELRVEANTDALLLWGGDDEASIYLDSKPLLTQTAPAKPGPGHAVAKLRLAKGRHIVWAKLRQNRGAWHFRMSLRSPDFGPLPGVVIVADDDPKCLRRQRKAAPRPSVSFEPRPGPSGLLPVVRVSSPGSVPAGKQAPIWVRLSLAGRNLGTFFGGNAGGERGLRVPYEAQLSPVSLKALGDTPSGALRADVQWGAQHAKWEGYLPAGLFGVLEGQEKALAAAKPKRAIGAASIRYEQADLLRFINQGDKDRVALGLQVKHLKKLQRELLAGKDPVFQTRGARRLAYRAPFDDKDVPFGLYLPPKFDPAMAEPLPLFVILHGMHGRPMQMMRWFFGRDDPNHLGPWEDRHPVTLPHIPAIVIAPYAYYNSMYRWAGEADVSHLLTWARATFKIKANDIHITGPSMGGTGTATVAFRYADHFASAAPLCGYHDYFMRTAIGGRPLLGYERDQVAGRSNTHWADNGFDLPLLIVHGEKDLPIENSEHLADAYRHLGYRYKFETLEDEGHNVWQPTYEGLGGYHWLRAFHRHENPRRAVIKTQSLRYRKNHWLHIDRLQRTGGFGEVKAQRRSRGKRLQIRTKGVDAFGLDAVATLPKLPRGAKRPSEVLAKLDGEAFSLTPGKPVSFHRSGGNWQRGPAEKPKGLWKHAGLEGPIADVYKEPLVIVVGSERPELARAHWALAEHFAKPRRDMDIHYPMVWDTDFRPQDYPKRAWVLIGGEDSNRWTGKLAEKLPIRVSSKGVVAGKRSFAGPGKGAAFIYPNPAQPKHYVVVLGAADLAGVLALASLPQMLPDFAIVDKGVLPARRQLVVGPAGRYVWSGHFGQDWQLP